VGRSRSTLAGVAALAAAFLAGALGPMSALSRVGAQEPAWQERCAARLRSAGEEIARIVPWAAGASVEVQSRGPGFPGFLVIYEADAGRRHISALVQDYVGATPGEWAPAGLGECPDEEARPPDLHVFRNYAARQAQLTIDRVPRRARGRIDALLRAALDACGSDG
jgi:hypothetical protein